MEGENRLEEIQSLLDAGHSRNKVASILGLHHQSVGRLIDKHCLELYTPFDENAERNHLYQNFEWLWEEDKLDEICRVATDRLEVNINDVLGNSYNDVGSYVREEYGDIYGYMHAKGMSHLSDMLFKNCNKCGRTAHISKFSSKKSRVFGVNTECTPCQITRYVERYNSDSSFRERQKVHAQNRRARKASLPDTLTVEVYESVILKHFNGECALTGRKVDLEIEHAIPLSFRKLLPDGKRNQSVKKWPQPFRMVRS